MEEKEPKTYLSENFAKVPQYFFFLFFFPAYITTSYILLKRTWGVLSCVSTLEWCSPQTLLNKPIISQTEH